MDKFFNPASVVVIGASNSPFNLGATICKALKDFLNFEGNIYTVNRKGEEVHGCPGYTAVTDLPEVPDLAVILTPASVVPTFMEQCGKKGVSNVIIESAGFSEEGDGGQDLQQQVNEHCEKYGIRFMGPNCLGTINAHSRFCTFYGISHLMLDMLQQNFDKAGTMSYIIQSGGVGVLVMESLISEVVHLNKMVSIGNKASIDESDMISYFAGDNSEVIGLYLENVTNGTKLMEAAKKADKPVLLYKVGRSEAGTQAALSHTAGMANNDAVFDSACRQAGIIRLNAISELYSLPKIFTTMPPLRGKNIAVFTNSGAYGGIAGDLLSEAGLSVVPLKEKTQEKLRKTGQIFNVKNPIDLGPAMAQTYLDIFEILLSADEVDGLLPIASIWQTFVIDVLKDLVEMCHKYEKPAALYSPNALERILEVRKEHALPLFESPEEAVRALSVSHQYHSFHAKRSTHNERITTSGNRSRSEGSVRI